MHTPKTTRLLTWALIVAVPFWFGSCSKSGSDSVTPASSIEGTWVYTGVKINPAVDPFKTGQKTNDLLALYTQVLGTDFQTCLTTTKVTFASGGKISGTPGSKCTAASSSQVPDPETGGTWKYDGSKLTITSADGKSSEVYDAVVSGNTLKIMQVDSSTDWDGDGKNDTETLTLEMARS
ncbi:lipocalin-like domain-containing protein [Spirosoma rhododendri]|uniref:Lipocalin family protein n=1 Tax=Spirosoma rhododendri TaxID=2728024 RepID=A0A7L5DYB0_9BACT|nr:lipocalin family protein [Spirosoma rhododendri]QJD80967.1 lipocalin family protein [Spirosoma rhododendri]